MISPALCIGLCLGHMYILPVLYPDNYVVNEMPMLTAWMHSSLVSVGQAEDCVCDQKAIYST